MKYKIKTTTETTTEIDVPAFWSSTHQQYFHKLLPDGRVLEVSVIKDMPHIKLTSIESGVFCGVNPIGEIIFENALTIAKTYLNI
jgi:hypothetical protein